MKNLNNLALILEMYNFIGKVHSNSNGNSTQTQTQQKLNVRLKLKTETQVWVRLVLVVEVIPPPPPPTTTFLRLSKQGSVGAQQGSRLSTYIYKMKVIPWTLEPVFFTSWVFIHGEQHKPKKKICLLHKFPITQVLLIMFSVLVSVSLL